MSAVSRSTPTGVFVSLLTLFCVSNTSSLAHAQSWQAIGNGPASVAEIGDPQMLFDASGQLHVAYQDRDAGLSGDKLSVVKLVPGTPSTWAYLGAQGAGSTNEPWFNRMAFAPNGDLWVAFYNYASSTQEQLGVHYFSQSTSTWVTAGTPPLPGYDNQAHYTSIVFDSLGRPVVGFQDGIPTSGGAAGGMTVMRGTFSGSAWTWSLLGGQGFNNSLPFGPPYSLPSNPPPVRRLTKWGTVGMDRVGNIWALFTDDGFPGSSGNTDYPVAAWYDESATPTPQWVFAGQPTSTEDAHFLHMTMDKNGVPNAAYVTWQNHIAVKRYFSGSWVAVGPNFASSPEIPIICDPGTNHERLSVSLEFTDSNVPFVAYIDANDSDRIHVRKYDRASNQWVMVGSALSPVNADYAVLVMGPDPANLTGARETPYVAFADPATSTIAKRLVVMAYY